MHIGEITASATLPLPDGEGFTATGLPLRAIESARYAEAEDRAIWTSGWVCLGSLHSIPGNGDILPYTLGNQGIHVQYMGGGKFAARFNKAPHGGCRFVPLQCQTGAKTRCAFTACGYSRDRGAMQQDDAAAHQYLGLRPERLVHIPVEISGPLIFVNLGETAPLPDIPAISNVFRNELWGEYAENWKEFPVRLFGRAKAEAEGNRLAAVIGLDGESLVLHWLFPNLLLLRGGQAECAIVIQPMALRLTMARISAFGAERDWHAALRKLLRREIGPAADAARFLRNLVNRKMEGVEA